MVTLAQHPVMGMLVVTRVEVETVPEAALAALAAMAMPEATQAKVPILAMARGLALMLVQFLSQPKQL